MCIFTIQCIRHILQYTSTVDFMYSTYMYGPSCVGRYHDMCNHTPHSADVFKCDISLVDSILYRWFLRALHFFDDIYSNYCINK